MAITPGNWLLTGSDRLKARPLQELINTLNDMGANIRKSKNGLIIHGKKLKAKEIEINCSESSQFASALLLIGDKIGLEHLKIFPHNYASSAYVNMTLKTILKIRDLPPNSMPETENDWSAAVYWYAMATLHPENQYIIPGLFHNSLQSDSIIAEWFIQLGVTTNFNKEGISIERTANAIPKSLQLDLTNNLDLAPVLCSLACTLPFKLTLRGIKNLEKKESKRKSVIIEQLSPFANISEPNEDTLIIEGFPKEKWMKSPWHFNAHKDHRFVMAFNLFHSFGEITIEGKEFINKSYPHFFQSANENRSI